MNEPDFLQRQSLSPSREKARSPADAMGLPVAKKIKKDEVSSTSNDCSSVDISLAAPSSERTDEANSPKGERRRPPQPQEGRRLTSQCSQLRLLNPSSSEEKWRRWEATDPQIWRPSLPLKHGEWLQPNIEGIAGSSLRSTRLPSTTRLAD